MELCQNVNGQAAARNEPKCRYLAIFLRNRGRSKDPFLPKPQAQHDYIAFLKEECRKMLDTDSVLQNPKNNDVDLYSFDLDF